MPQCTKVCSISNPFARGYLILEAKRELIDSHGQTLPLLLISAQKHCGICR
jgi:hypothetical protein